MIITSFGPEGYDLYGRKFIESYLQHENTIPLIVYVEGQEQLIDVANDFPYIIVKDLFQVSGVEKILKEMGANPVMRGETQDHEGNPVKTWRLNAFTYCRKVFAFHHAIMQAKTDSDRSIVCWVDADVEFIGKLPHSFGSIILPDHDAISYLGRSNMHSETGFMAADANHPKINLFLALYWGLYATGAFANLREWHDCYIFDHARALSACPSYNLSTDLESLYPWDTSVLSQWMKHHKGPVRKQEEYGAQVEGGAEDDR